MPPSPSPLPLFLSWGLVRGFRPKFVHSWVHLYHFSEWSSVYVDPRILYLHAIAWTEVRAIFSVLEISPKMEPDFSVPNYFFFLGWVCLDFPVVSRAKRHWVWRWALLQPHLHSKLTSDCDRWPMISSKTSLQQFLESSTLFNKSVNLVCVKYRHVGILMLWIQAVCNRLF